LAARRATGGALALLAIAAGCGGGAERDTEQAAVMPRASARFEGRTSQGLPIAFSSSRDARRVAGISFRYTCTLIASDEAASSPEVEVSGLGPLEVSRGRFSNTAFETGTPGFALIEGRFEAPDRARGELRVAAREAPGRGRCRAARAAWSAHAR
jgi:hypothetical protein